MSTSPSIKTQDTPTDVVPRCEICNWPLAKEQAKGCIPGDCSYRPDDPAEQQRIRERRAALAQEAVNLEEAREMSALADEYAKGLQKLIECGYEEYGPVVQRKHSLTIRALRFTASSLSSTERGGK